MLLKVFTFGLTSDSIYLSGGRGGRDWQWQLWATEGGGNPEFLQSSLWRLDPMTPAPGVKESEKHQARALPPPPAPPGGALRRPSPVCEDCRAGLTVLTPRGPSHICQQLLGSLRLLSSTLNPEFPVGRGRNLSLATLLNRLRFVCVPLTEAPRAGGFAP